MPAPLTSPDSVFPPLRCSGGSLIPSEAACLWSCLQYLKSMLSWAEIRWLVIFITAFYAQAPRSFQKGSYDIWYTWSAIHSLATTPPTRTDFICKACLTYTAFLLHLGIKMSLKEESNSFFSSVLVSCIYLSICFLFSTVLLYTFFSVHVLFLKLYAQFFFSLQFTQ